MNKRITLKKVKVFERSTLLRKGETDIVVLFSNGVYQAITLRPEMSPADIGELLMTLGEAIRMDGNLK